MPQDGRNESENHQGQLIKIGIAILCLSLVATAFIGPSARAEEERTCAMAIDFGDGRVMWADVPVHEGMNGFDVFLNATELMGLDESHSPTPPYGHTVIRVDNCSMEYDFANPASSGRLWHLWYWDAQQNTWLISNTLLDGIDALSTPAIILTYHKDPWGPPTLPLEHEATVPEVSDNSSTAPTESTASLPASEGFPIWGWGVVALVLLFGAEVIFLYRKRGR